MKMKPQQIRASENERRKSCIDLLEALWLAEARAWPTTGRDGLRSTLANHLDHRIDMERLCGLVVGSIRAEKRRGVDAMLARMNREAQRTRLRLRQGRA